MVHHAANGVSKLPVRSCSAYSHAPQPLGKLKGREIIDSEGEQFIPVQKFVPREHICQIPDSFGPFRVLKKFIQLVFHS
jgi:hypothetical protein